MLRAHLHLPKIKRGDSDVISVKPRAGSTFYVADLKLKDVTFKVNEGGRQRVIAKRQREVHAWVVGNEVDELGAGYWQMATYNPYKCETFVNVDTGKPVLSASYAYMNGKDVYYLP